jgi:hypothetical protein
LRAVSKVAAAVACVTGPCPRPAPPSPAMTATAAGQEMPGCKLASDGVRTFGFAAAPPATRLAWCKAQTRACSWGGGPLAGNRASVAPNHDVYVLLPRSISQAVFGAGYVLWLTAGQVARASGFGLVSCAWVQGFPGWQHAPPAGDCGALRRPPPPAERGRTPQALNHAARSNWDTSAVARSLACTRVLPKSRAEQLVVPRPPPSAPPRPTPPRSNNGRDHLHQLAPGGAPLGGSGGEEEGRKLRGDTFRQHSCRPRGPMGRPARATASTQFTGENGTARTPAWMPCCNR